MGRGGGGGRGRGCQGCSIMPRLSVSDKVAAAAQLLCRIEQWM